MESCKGIVSAKFSSQLINQFFFKHGHFIQIIRHKWQTSTAQMMFDKIFLRADETL